MPPKAKCLNPVFTAWLEDMRDELDPESKYRNVYHRAAKAMRAHDRCLDHPKECAEVKYVGPKIRDRLVKRHNELQGNGSESVESPIKPSRFKTAGEKSPPEYSKTKIQNSTNSSSDEGQVIRLSQPGTSGRVPLSVTAPLEPATPAPKKISKARKLEDPGTLSGSESELEPISFGQPKAPRVKLLQYATTPRSPRRTKPTPSRPRLSHFVPAPAATSDADLDSETAKAVPSTPAFDPLVFSADSYTIQMILDEREVKSMKNRDYMLNGLRKRGVDVEKRALEIGDMCWIARLKDAADDAQAECVLDYIVERKRMDDLKSSILDGRFHEQKFRLKHTGISHLYYLVEDYNNEQVVQHWKDQINTALSSTQVIDRFFLKETLNIEDTLDFLSGLHKTITKLHQNKALHIIPPRLIKRHSFLALKQEIEGMNDSRIYHTTYQSYQHLNRKNGFYSLQDNMARILQCIRGLSEEKIAVLIAQYPTPRSLYEAFKAAEERASNWEDPVSSQMSAKGKGKGVTKSKAPTPNTMLSELGGQGRRKIGPALSKHIYDVFMSPS